MTHDLLVSTIAKLGAKLDRIVITKLEQNTFFAKLVLQIDSRFEEVDARPSDSIALALRAKARIFVEEQVLTRVSNNLE
ncbi:MAG: bifunctional nuclease family protein, partial [Candidatus Omnitrophica bacterium]|nr:bifunctional nuclease family protein [Candidatus Omnitrophota bacterium]